MKSQKQNLRIPGPTPLPLEVLKAGGKQMINHRSPSYEEIHKRVIRNLQYFFQTENDVFLITSSGMGGLETAVVNFFSPGDQVVNFTCGEFGNRWADVARAYNLDVFQVKIDPGQAVTPQKVKETLNKMSGIKGVFITLNETASAVTNPIKELAPIIKAHPDNPLLLVDGISGLGAIDLPMDDLKIDVLVTASQKAWMAPPGISMVAVSSQAWESHKTAGCPRYYFDLTLFKKFAEKNQTPATPAVSVILAMDTALEIMRKTGREEVFAKHIKLAKYCRRKIRDIGLELFVSDEYASSTLTSIVIPPGIDGHEWLKILRTEYNVVLAGGMVETKGKIVRIAHMGYVSEMDLDEAIAAMKESLAKLKK